MISLVFRLLLNPRVPLRTKLIPALAIGYVVLPFDLLPDFIPILGGVDDAILAIVAAYAFVLLGTRYLAAARPDNAGEKAATQRTGWWTPPITSLRKSEGEGLGRTQPGNSATWK